MADVKWQIPKKAGVEALQVEPETTEDTVDTPMEEMSKQEEITSEMAQPSVRGREATRVLTMHAVQPEEGASDLIAEGAQTTQHQQVIKQATMYQPSQLYL